MPPTPSFWFTPLYERDQLRFLRSFTESVTEPVVHDGREHIDYVPTQILTEYLRHEYGTYNGQRLDGIMYPSAQHNTGKNIVLFTNQDDLTPENEQQYTNNTPLLRLQEKSIESIPKE